MKTLTGKPLLAAFAELNKQLEPNAYKEITGGKGGKLGLTDIKPAYLPEQLLELFGPYGWGWGFDLLEMKTIDRQAKRSAGYEETEYVSTCKIAAWFRFDVEGSIQKSDAMIGTGGSDNTQIEWAEKGAITSALGTAWFFAGYQLDVYKGLRSHSKTSTTAYQKNKDKADPPQPPTSTASATTNTGVLKKELLDYSFGKVEDAAAMLKDLSTFTGTDKVEKWATWDKIDTISAKWEASILAAFYKLHPKVSE